MGDTKKKYSADELLQYAYQHNQIPVILLAKDKDCRYIYTSEVEDLIDGGEEKSILGKTDMDIQYDEKLGKLYYDQDKDIMRTGNPCHCYSEFDQDGKTVYKEIAKNPVYVDGKIYGVCGVVNDVTELMSLKKKFESLTFYDNLTGLYNRNYFLKFDFNKSVCLPCTYMMCDCNDLKGVNDHLGHNTGDLYIRETANILKEVLPKDGICIRWGGDEFLLITPSCSEETHETLLKSIKDYREKVSDIEPDTGLAVGGALRTRLEISEKDIIKTADARMYSDKALYKKQHRKIS